MPGIWGSGLDTLLRDITESISFNSASGFPLKDIEARMATRGKSLEFGEEQVEDLLICHSGSAVSIRGHEEQAPC